MTCSPQLLGRRDHELLVAEELGKDVKVEPVVVETGSGEPERREFLQFYWHRCVPP